MGRDESGLEKQIPKNPLVVQIRNEWWKPWIFFEVPAGYKGVVLYDNKFYEEDANIYLDNSNNSGGVGRNQLKKSRIIDPTKTAFSLKYKRDLYLVHIGSRRIDPLEQNLETRNGIEIIGDAVGEYKITSPELICIDYAGKHFSPSEIILDIEQRINSIMKNAVINFVKSQNYPIQNTHVKITNADDYYQQTLRELGISLGISIENLRQRDETNKQKNL